MNIKNQILKKFQFIDQVFVPLKAILKKMKFSKYSILFSQFVSGTLFCILFQKWLKNSLSLTMYHWYMDLMTKKNI